MAEYVSNYSGDQLDAVLALLHNKGLGSVTGVVKRNADGTFSAIDVAAKSSTTATLTTNGWSNNTQTVNVTGVTASNDIIVSTAPASKDDYTSAGIFCTAQAAGTLTFTCDTVPTSAITVNVLILS